MELRARGHFPAASAGICANTFNAGGGNASYSSPIPRRPALWSRTRPTKVETAPSPLRATAAATAAGSRTAAVTRKASIRSVYPPEVVERAVPGTEARRMADGPFEVGARRAQGLVDRLPEGQVGGNRRRERASGPVRVAGLDPRPSQLEFAVGRADDVGHETVDRKM